MGVGARGGGRSSRSGLRSSCPSWGHVSGAAQHPWTASSHWSPSPSSLPCSFPGSADSTLPLNTTLLFLPLHFLPGGQACYNILLCDNFHPLGSNWSICFLSSPRTRVTLALGPSSLTVSIRAFASQRWLSLPLPFPSLSICLSAHRPRSTGLPGWARWPEREHQSLLCMAWKLLEAMGRRGR